MTKSKSKKGESNKTLIIVAIVVLLIVLFFVLGLLKKDKVNSNPPDMETIQSEGFKVTYYYAKAYGTEADTTPRVIIIDQDGNVIISLSDEDIGVEPMEYEVGKEKAKLVVDYINRNEFLKLDSDIGTECMDGVTEYFMIKNNNIDVKIGGRCISEQLFRDFVSYYLDIIDKAKLDKFNKTVTMMYDYE